jgi:hypothetical protein
MRPLLRDLKQLKKRGDHGECSDASNGGCVEADRKGGLASDEAAVDVEVNKTAWFATFDKPRKATAVCFLLSICVSRASFVCCATLLEVATADLVGRWEGALGRAVRAAPAGFVAAADQVRRDLAVIFGGTGDDLREASA